VNPTDANGDAPLPLPIRVLVKGASTVLITSFMDGPRTDMPYNRVIEDELLAAGQPAEVRTTARISELTKRAMKVWDQEILTWSPDVVIYHYGHMETIHLMIPRWLERHANSQHGRPQPVRSRYRKLLLKPAYRQLGLLQKRVDAALPAGVTNARIRRTTRDLQQLITHARWVASPLVLVPELLPAGHTYQKWFPGVDRRIEAVNASFGQMIDGFAEPDIRSFSLAKVVEPVLEPGDEAMPDGGHFSPKVHRAIGTAMAAEILAWAKQQPHLARR
jgi:hypothetical protein